jgi:hypothetical protein
LFIVFLQFGPDGNTMIDDAGRVLCCSRVVDFGWCLPDRPPGLMHVNQIAPA